MATRSAEGAVGHNNNWAVLVCTSTFWFNYRHVANVLSIYHIVKEMGIADDHIILMLADDMACNARNAIPGTVFNHYDHVLNVYGGGDVEVDYRGAEVTVDNFIRLLTNRLPEGTPRSKRLASDEQSNILIYLTGHGGNNFLKFQDSEEMNAHDLAGVLDQMAERQRYNEILLLIDTCQASTMYEHVTAPHVFAMSSSVRGESSYSYHVDEEIGVPVLDRFTWSLLQYMAKHNVTDATESGTGNGEGAALSIQDLFDSFDAKFLSSHPHMQVTPGTRSPKHAKITDFFGNVHRVDLSREDPVKFSTRQSVDGRFPSGDSQGRQPKVTTARRMREPLAIAGRPSDKALGSSEQDDEGGVLYFAQRAVAFGQPPCRHFFPIHASSDGALLGSAEMSLVRYFLSAIALVILFGLVKPMRPATERWRQC